MPMKDQKGDGRERAGFKYGTERKLSEITVLPVIVDNADAL